MLADFIVEFTLPDLDLEVEYWTICADSLSVVGFGGVGVIVTLLEKDILKYGVQLQFLATNNEAEYEAILASLRIEKALGVKNLKLRIDSKLIVGQVTNEYKAKEERMKRYLRLMSQLFDDFDDVRFEQIPWENNLVANEVAKLASTEDAPKKLGLYMEVQTILSVKGLQAFPIQQLSTWMDLILSYIRDGQLPLDPSKAKKVRVRATRFIVMNGELYKRGFSLSYLKCLNPEEESYVLREIHEGICDNHLRPQSLVGKAIRVGYFWPTMQKDVVELVKKCDKCQWFENVQHVPGELMTSISSPWPFSTWGINIIGPLP